MQLFGEFSDLASLIWCFGLSTIVWFLTSFRRTRDARAVCLTICVCSSLFERMLDRQTTRTICIIVLAGVILKYRQSFIDYSKRSCDLIDEMAESI
jgi:hypothetical protein